MKTKYVLVSTELWGISDDGTHVILERAETEIQIPSGHRRSNFLSNLMDAGQRAIADQIDRLKTHLDNY